MARKSYDPGQPTVPVRMPDGYWSVDSFRAAGSSYVVDLAAGTCSCPDFGKRHADAGTQCKHLRAVRVQCWAGYTEKARQVSDRALPALIEKYESRGELEIALALRAELLDRAQAVTA